MRGDDAVSPVWGGVLLVAVAIGLAAAVWAIAETEVGRVDRSVPAVTWALDEGTDSVQVVKAPNDVPWSQYRLRADQDLRFRVGDAAFTLLPAGEAVRIADDANIQAGGRIVFCAEVAGPAEVQLIHIERDRTVNRFSFSNVAAC